MEFQSKEQNIRAKGELRTIGGAIGAYIEFIIAIEALTVKLAGT
ncbi:hypothetical protein [Pseudomonas sp. ANT_J12]|nr:hypothetical protein [Pseudomonas sp. ANT_J12]